MPRKKTDKDFNLPEEYQIDSNVESEIRQNYILKKMISGDYSMKILRKDVIERFDITANQIDRDFHAVEKSLSEKLTSEKDNLIKIHIARYEDLYFKLSSPTIDGKINKAYNPKNAAAILKQKEELLKKMNEDNDKKINNQQNNYTQNNINIENASMEELMKIIEMSDKKSNK